MNKTGSQLGDGYGDVSLYSSSAHNKDTLVDYLAYGKASATTNATHANDAGIWAKDDFIADVSSGRSIELKNEDSNLSSDWQESCADGGTPGKDNSKKSDCLVPEEKINSNFKIKKDDEVYKNIYANFEVDYSDATDATKYTWDFGDGHKSYLQKTRHKYEEIGIYQASIAVRGDKKDSQSFTIEVEDYSAPKIRIIRLVPNPKGNDTKNEYIEIENRSKEKINLLNWSVATGWKNMANHPIRDDFIIKPGKSKKLTKKICAFVLNNDKNKIELRYPDGDVAQKLKYNRKKDKIEEDEVMEKSGKNWTWNKLQADIKEKQSDAENSNSAFSPEEEGQMNAGPKEDRATDQEEAMPGADIQISKSELEAGLGKYSENPAFAAKKQNRVQLVGYNTRINTPVILVEPSGQVAGACSEKRNIPEEKHWLFQITDTLWFKTNSGLNWILNRI